VIFGCQHTPHGGTRTVDDAARVALRADAAPAPAAKAAGDMPKPDTTDPRTGDHLITRAHQAMGTVITLTAWAEDDAKVVAAFDLAFAEFDRIDHLMTTWTDDSEISKINAAAGTGKPVPVSDEVMLVLERAAEGSKISDGAFDITVGSFHGLWKFDEDNDGTIPDPKEVEARRKLVDWHDVILDPKAKTAMLRRKGQQITLGGIAKGYSVDKAVAILAKAGLVDFIVQAGGDMYVSGRHGDRKWKVGIRDPRGPREQFFAFAEIEDATFSTSGDYERYVIKDGKRYHHIIDPSTGYPAMLTRSVTVMAKDAFTADELSKGFFILGPEKGLALAEKLGVDVVFVGADNKVTVSKGLKDKLTIKPEGPTDGL
jgi:thiamine biosynthesis lipoprotein